MREYRFDRDRRPPANGRSGPDPTRRVYTKRETGVSRRRAKKPTKRRENEIRAPGPHEADFSRRAYGDLGGVIFGADIRTHETQRDRQPVGALGALLGGKRPAGTVRAGRRLFRPMRPAVGQADRRQPGQISVEERCRSRRAVAGARRPRTRTRMRPSPEDHGPRRHHRHRQLRRRAAAVAAARDRKGRRDQPRRDRHVRNRRVLRG